MDELAHDLASALDETAEQARLDEVRCGSQRRQARRRRGRKRRSNSDHPLEYGRRYSEASESSGGEAGGGAGGAGAAASDSDDDRAVVQRLSSLNVTLKGRHHSWHESDSFTETTPGQPRRRRRVKRGGAEPQAPAHPCPLRGPCQHKKQRLCRPATETPWLAPHRDGAETPCCTPGPGTHSPHPHPAPSCASLEHKASDETMTDSEASSVGSSDGLFTNDEGRQGDDEQSDWFYEGECEQGFRVPQLLPHWDSPLRPPPPDAQPGGSTYPSPPFLLPTRPPQRGYHARLNRFPGIAARCIRKGRRRLVGKEGPVGWGVGERAAHFGHEPYQKEARRSVCVRGGQCRDWGVLSRLQPLRVGFSPLMPLYPLEVLADKKCPTPQNKSRQTSVHLGSLCTGDVKRRRKTAALPTASAASCHHGEDEGRSPEQASSKSSACMEWAGGEGREGEGTQGAGLAEQVNPLVPVPPVVAAQL